MKYYCHDSALVPTCSLQLCGHTPTWVPGWWDRPRWQSSFHRLLNCRTFGDVGAGALSHRPAKNWTGANKAVAVVSTNLDGSPIGKKKWIVMDCVVEMNSGTTSFYKFLLVMAWEKWPCVKIHLTNLLLSGYPGQFWTFDPPWIHHGPPRNRMSFNFCACRFCFTCSIRSASSQGQDPCFHWGLWDEHSASVWYLRLCKTLIWHGARPGFQYECLKTKLFSR